MLVSRIRSRAYLAALLLVTAPFCQSNVPTEAPDDRAPVAQQMQAIIDYVDSPNYARQVTWYEHILLAYRAAHGRDPSALEAYLLTGLRDQIGLTRSEALSIALRGASIGPTWAQVGNLVDNLDATAFVPTAEVTEAAPRLAAATLDELRTELRAHHRNPAVHLDESYGIEPPVPDVGYQTYFGYMHAHSELSDGEGSAMQAYNYARLAGRLDFFALTDHGELLSVWPWERKWKTLKRAANLTNSPGRFVSLWGFEWSSPIYGHINVINTDEFTNALFHLDISAFYDWLRARPKGIGRFNHPGREDSLQREFEHLADPSTVVRQMVGIENWNKDGSFDRYYYAGSWPRLNPFETLSYWDAGNRQGWYLGSLGGQDNHSPDWGTRNDYRTAVLAESLTRESILEAYRQRRFYATEDKDLLLDFRVDGYPMGSRLRRRAERVFEVRASDGSRDRFSNVRLYRNGELLESRAVAGREIDETFTDPGTSRPAYYYVIVQQTDDGDENGRDDEAISSPIWFGRLR